MKLIAFCICLLMITAVSGQSELNSKIEIRLSLIQKTNGQQIDATALGISIFNLEDFGIYIPNFYIVAIYSGMHLYQEVAGEWEELDLFTHELSQPYQPPQKKNGMLIETLPIPDTKRNSLTLANNSRALAFGLEQKRLFGLLYNDKISQKNQVFENEVPLFLKAKEQVWNCSLIDLDWLLARPGRYKISFNFDMNRSRRQYTDTILPSNPPIRLPAESHGYRRTMLPTVDIVSNTIYFSMVNYD